MSDVAGASAAPAPSPPPAPPSGPISSREAAGLLGKLRDAAPPAAVTASDVNDAPAAEPNSEPSQDGPEENTETAPPEERPDGESDPEQPDPAVNQPSIEPPRSWTKEQKALFATFPPEAQQKIAETEQARESDFLRRQNEQAEVTKAAQAKADELEQQRQQYEQALPALMSMLAEQQAGEFADVKTWDDVSRLATTDPQRYLKWEVHNKRITAVQTEIQAAEARRGQETTERFNAWSAEQDQLFAKQAPEFNDPKLATKARSDVISYLKDVGISDDEVKAAWSGQTGLSLRDHRAQIIIRDAARWRSAEAARKAAATRTAPPVQRPGVTQPKGAGRVADIADARKQLERSGSAKDAVALLRKMNGTKR